MEGWITNEEGVPRADEDVVEFGGVERLDARPRPRQDERRFRIECHVGDATSSKEDDENDELNLKMTDRCGID